MQLDTEEQFEISLRYGNTKRFVQDSFCDAFGGQHNVLCTLFVKLQTTSYTWTYDLLESVIYTFPDFINGNTNQRMRLAPFECTEVFRQPVNVEIELKFRKIRGVRIGNVKLSHKLSFLPHGQSKLHKMSIPRSLAEDIGLC